MLPPAKKSEKDLGTEHDQPQEEHKKAQAHEQAPVTQERKYKFQVLVDGDMHLASLKVGHAWVRMISPDNEVHSWGFWPAHPLNPLLAWRSTQGMVKSPDRAHSPTAINNYEIDHEHAEKMEKAVAQRKASPGDYNLFTRNCVHFSADMCHAAGVSIPSFSTLGVANPSKLAASIEKENAKEGHDAMDRPMAPSKFGSPELPGKN